MIPSGLLTPGDAKAIAGRFGQWFGDAEVFKLVRSNVGQVGDRTHLSYCFHLREAGRWSICEQQIYCEVRDGRIGAIDLVCSGFRPADSASA